MKAKVPLGRVATLVFLLLALAAGCINEQYQDQAAVNGFIVRIRAGDVAHSPSENVYFVPVDVTFSEEPGFGYHDLELWSVDDDFLDKDVFLYEEVFPFPTFLVFRVQEGSNTGSAIRLLLLEVENRIQRAQYPGGEDVRDIYGWFANELYKILKFRISAR